MSGSLLFIRGIYDTIDLFIESFSEAFRQLGRPCHVLDVRHGGQALLQLKGILEEETVDGVVTFNNIGYNLSFDGGGNIWEETGIPYFNILMDHPFHYARPLECAPSTSVVFCTDRNHTAFLRRFYPHLKQVDFMPHAGVEAKMRHPAMEERTVDVLYAGGLSRFVAEGLVPDLGEIAQFDAFALTQEVLSDLMRHPQKTTESAIEEYLLAAGKRYTERELNHWINELRFIDSYAASFFREQSVRLLVESGIPVTVFGGGWDQCEWAHNPNLIYGGKVLAPQVLELMNHSKIVLNTMTWYKNGIHDRIINGMLAKAAVVTDPSKYLQDSFLREDKPCLAAFSLPQIQMLPDLVKELLCHPARMEELAENGYRYAQAHHTFLQRAEYILNKYLSQ